MTNSSHPTTTPAPTATPWPTTTPAPYSPERTRNGTTPAPTTTPWPTTTPAPYVPPVQPVAMRAVPLGANKEAEAQAAIAKNERYAAEGQAEARMTSVKLIHNYRPVGEYEVVSEPDQKPGLSSKDKLWAGSVVRLPKDEADGLVVNGNALKS